MNDANIEELTNRLLRRELSVLALNESHTQRVLIFLLRKVRENNGGR